MAKKSSKKSTPRKKAVTRKVEVKKVEETRPAEAAAPAAGPKRTVREARRAYLNGPKIPGPRRKPRYEPIVRKQ